VHLIASLVQKAMLDHQAGEVKGRTLLCHKPQLWNHPLYSPITAGEHELGQDDRQEKYWGQSQKYS
jgi:hypothetical protein